MARKPAARAEFRLNPRGMPGLNPALVKRANLFILTRAQFEQSAPVPEFVWRRGGTICIEAIWPPSSAPADRSLDSARASRSSCAMEAGSTRSGRKDLRRQLRSLLDDNCNRSSRQLAALALPRPRPRNSSVPVRWHSLAHSAAPASAHRSRFRYRAPVASPDAGHCATIERGFDDGLCFRQSTASDVTEIRLRIPSARQCATPARAAVTRCERRYTVSSRLKDTVRLRDQAGAVEMQHVTDRHAGIGFGLFDAAARGRCPRDESATRTCETLTSGRHSPHAALGRCNSA